MIFQYTLESVLSGKKTQTRRRIKPDKKFIYKVGRTYAVQPKRGQPAVARFEAIAIRKQRLGGMTHEEALAEGFASVADYQKLWRRQYGSFDPDEEVWVIEFKLLQAL
jgi:hypothetical protein